MLSLLKIKHVALIDEVEIEFGRGLNLLTGETGSGKSIIVDSLGALTGERVSSDLIKQGEETAQIEGLFTVERTKEITRIFDDAGIEIEDEKEIEVIVRRDLSATGRNRVFVNNQLVTQSFLKTVGGLLVDIHGQGEQAALYDTATHIDMLDEYAALLPLREKVAEAYKNWSSVKMELADLEQNEAEKLQLLDVLRFQVAEIERVNLQTGEDTELETERLRLNNIEKLSRLSDDAFANLYDNDASTLATLDKAARDVAELSEYDAVFRDHADAFANARALLEDIAYALRDFRERLESSPERLAEIDDRLAEITRLKRKYGDSIETIISHLADARSRLDSIETAEFREEELRKKLDTLKAEFLKLADELHDKRTAAARKIEKEIGQALKAVPMEKAKFEVRFDNDETGQRLSPKGIDRIEFYFSANPGEVPRPLAKVASGGEASRLMLVLKTTARSRSGEKTAVFDEIDVGIGGRVAEAVGLKLKELSKTQQVLCVTHQPQIASLADRHFVVDKAVLKNKTVVGVRDLGDAERVEEIARMLAGEKVSDTAREHAREMLAGGQ